MSMISVCSYPCTCEKDGTIRVEEKNAGKDLGSVRPGKIACPGQKCRFVPFCPAKWCAVLPFCPFVIPTYAKWRPKGQNSKKAKGQKGRAKRQKCILL